eukprot:265055-Chlamydomonas_euryale.AAC.2
MAIIRIAPHLNEVRRTGPPSWPSERPRHTRTVQQDSPHAGDTTCPHARARAAREARRALRRRGPYPRRRSAPDVQPTVARVLCAPGASYLLRPASPPPPFARASDPGKQPSSALPSHAGGVTAAAGNATQRRRGGARSAPPPPAARRRTPWRAVTVATAADFADCFLGSQHGLKLQLQQGRVWAVVCFGPNTPTLRSAYGQPSARSADMGCATSSASRRGAADAPAAELAELPPPAAAAPAAAAAAAVEPEAPACSGDPSRHAALLAAADAGDVIALRACLDATEPSPFRDCQRPHAPDPAVDLDARQTGDGATPLMLAALRGSEEAVRWAASSATAVLLMMPRISHPRGLPRTTFLPA